MIGGREMRTYTEILEFLRNELFADGKLYSFNEVCLKIREKRGEPLENSDVALCLTNLLREGSVVLVTTTEPKTGMVVVAFRLSPVRKTEIVGISD